MASRVSVAVGVVVVAAAAGAFALGRSSAHPSKAAAPVAPVASSSRSSSVATLPTSTVALTVPPTTFPPIVLTSPVDLKYVLDQEAVKLGGGGFVSSSDVEAFVAEYQSFERRQQLAKDAGRTYLTSDPVAQADAWILAHHGQEVADYAMAKTMQGFHEMLGTLGQTTTTTVPCPPVMFCP